MADTPVDIAILGGGLSGGLIAHALRARRPDLSVALIEAGPTLGGNHLWSFFTGDIASRDWALVEPFVEHSWPRYNVLFPARRRVIDHRYNSVTSAHFDRVLRALLPPGAIVTGQAGEAADGCVRLASGRTIPARAIIDARGSGDLSTLRCGWQKFVGQRLRLAAPHGLDAPIVMDATVDQAEGYRFVYVLPLSPDTVFVEDTYYNDLPQIDRRELAGRIADYAAARGWTIAAVEHEEQGVLPVVTGGDWAAYWASTGPHAKAGVRAGLFHPMTGYSLPDAVRLASAIADAPDLSQGALDRLTREAAQQAWRRGGFYRLLGQMLFHAADAPDRYRVLERFYRLPAALIGRFYAGETTLGDRMRILIGRPPVPLSRAIGAIIRSGE